MGLVGLGGGRGEGGWSSRVQSIVGEIQIFDLLIAMVKYLHFPPVLKVVFGHSAMNNSAKLFWLSRNDCHHRIIKFRRTSGPLPPPPANSRTATTPPSANPAPNQALLRPILRTIAMADSCSKRRAEFQLCGSNPTCLCSPPW